VVKKANLPGLGDTKIRATRLIPQHPCFVETKTIGTSLAFNLPLKNFSKTGLLLGTGTYQRIPFQVHTILELKVDLKGSTFDQPITLLGKIVRVCKDQGKTFQLGLQLLSLDGKDTAHWQKAMDTLEATIPIPAAHEHRS